MNWKFSDHVELQLSERNISTQTVQDALEAPDEVVKGKRERLIYHKFIDKKLMRVVTEGDLIVTVYLTSKISKYYEGQ
jgi:hypothetical protein